MSDHTLPPAQHLVMIGAGGHARVLLDALAENKQQLSALCLPPQAPIPPWGRALPCMTSDAELVERFPPGITRLILGIGSVATNHKRMHLFQHYQSLGYRFASILHPHHYQAREVVLGEGCQIMAGAIVQTACILHDNVIINTRATVDHECVIDSHVHIAPGAVLSGGIHIGCAAHIGTGAVIIQGLHIGAAALVAAGAVVVDNVPDGTAVAGVPAKPMRHKSLPHL
ncbi:MAG: NeuD/PglB/VioB family sugar acetyltransferase [Magnetococcales bacterium]|nr:NeuD/PglB/VioB family sugar acetyltransferase [Magnetococcales bacterium]